MCSVKWGAKPSDPLLQNQPSQFKSERGVSLTEAMIALLIASVIIIIDTTFFVYSGRANQRQMVVAEMNSLMAEIRRELGMINLCTTALSQVQISPEPTEVILSRGNDTPLSPEITMVAKNMLIGSGTAIESATVKKVADLSEGSMLAELRIIGRTRDSSSRIERPMNIVVAVDAGGVTRSCLHNNPIPAPEPPPESGGGGGSGTEVPGTPCDVNPSKYFVDPVSGECRSRFEERCFDGTADSAKCSANAVSVRSCKVLNVTDDPAIPPPVRTYDDGSTAPISMPPAWECQTDAMSFTATCSTATDALISPPGAVCQICCVVDISTP